MGQSGKAEVSGVARDISQRVIDEASLVMINQQTRAEYWTETNEQGQFHFIGLAPGEYKLAATKAGFQAYRRDGLGLRIADQISLDFQMQVGALSEAVEVNAEAPLIEQSPGVSFGVDEKRIAALPLDGRNFIPLIALAPGVALPGGGSLLPRINGSRPRTNECIYDGVSALQRDWTDTSAAGSESSADFPTCLMTIRR